MRTEGTSWLRENWEVGQDGDIGESLHAALEVLRGFLLSDWKHILYSEKKLSPENTNLRAA